MVAVNRSSNDGNYVFNLNIDIDGVVTKFPKNLKAAIFFFEIEDEHPRSMYNMVKNLWGSNFLPLATELILQPNMETTYSNISPLIKIISLDSINNKYAFNRNPNMSNTWTVNIPDVEFISKRSSLQHASFCVITYVDVASGRSFGNRTLLNSTKKYLKNKGNTRNFMRDYVDSSNPEKSLIYDYYSFDFAIAIDKKMVNSGILFKRRDTGAYYVGPVHKMSNGSYMTGRYHGDTKMNAQERDIELITDTVPYGKVQDYALVNKNDSSIWSNLYDVCGIKNIISSIEEESGLRKDSFALKTEAPKKFIKDFTSLDKQYDFNTLFTLDVLDLLLNKTPFYTSLYNMLQNADTDDNRSILTQIANLSTIEHGEIIRRQVGDSSHTTKLTTKSFTLSDLNEFVLTTDPGIANSPPPPRSILMFSDKNKGALREIKNFSFQKDNENNYLRAFSFKESIDNANSYSSKYQYKIKLMIKDGAVIYANNLVLDLATKYALFDRDIESVLKLNKENKFSVEFIESQFGVDYISNFNNNILIPLVQAVSSVIKFFSPQSLNKGNIEKVFFARANFVTGDVAGVEAVKEVIADLIEALSKMTNLNLKIKNALEFVYNENKVSISRDAISTGKSETWRSKIHQQREPTLPTAFDHTENFESVLDNTAYAGYEFITANPNASFGIKTISIGDYNQRSTEEIGKYFNVNKLKEVAMTAGSNIPIQQNQTRFFTPNSFKLGDRFYKLPREFNISTKSLTFKNLLDIMYFKEFLDYSKAANVQTNRLSSKITSITLQGNSLQAAVKPKKIIINTGDLVEKMDHFGQGANWKKLETEQGAQIDSIALIEDEKATTLETSRGLSNFNITTYMVGSRVLSKKTNLATSYAGTAQFIKQKIYNPGTPPQLLSLLLKLNAQKITSTSAQTRPREYEILNSLKDSELKPENLDWKSLNDYGIPWFNYDLMVEIRYCASLDMKEGIRWLPLTNDVLQSSMKNGSAMLCKCFRKTDGRLNQIQNDFLDLPIFNEYFMIQSSKPSNKINLGSTERLMTSMQKNIYKVADLIKKYSNDFCKFIQPNVLKIMGAPQKKTVLSMKTDITEGVISAIINKDPDKIKTIPKPLAGVSGVASTAASPTAPQGGGSSGGMY